MSQPTMPNADELFDEFAKTFVSNAAASPAAYGLTAQDVTELQDALGAWSPAYVAHKELVKKGIAVTSTKKSTRKALRSVIGNKMRKVNALPGVTNVQRTALGMSPHAETATAVAPPTTWPLARIVDMGGRRQAVHWVDQATPDRRAKPRGVQLCELWLKIGDGKPVDETGCVLVKRCTRTPYVHTFAPGDVGKTAYWMLRWENKKAEFGPWAPAVVVTVPA